MAGVARVVVQVLTGDANAKLAQLGTASAVAAKKIEDSFGAAGAASSAELDALAASGNKTAQALIAANTRVERSRKSLDTYMARSVADQVEADARVVAATERTAQAQRALATAHARSADEIKAANDVVLESQLKVLKAQQAIAATPANRSGLLNLRTAAASRAQQQLAQDQAALAMARAKGAAPSTFARFEGLVGAASMAEDHTRETVERQVGGRQRSVAAGLGGAARSAEETQKYAQAAHEADLRTKGLIQSAGKFGGMSAGMLAAGTALAAAEAVKMGMGFENAQARIEGSTSRDEASAGKLTKAFEGTAGQFQASGQELESGYADVAKQLDKTMELLAGHIVTTGEAMKFTTAAGDLQAATGEKLNNITKDLATTMQVYKIKVSEAASVSDRLYNASRNVSTSVDSMESLVTKLHARLGDLGGGLSSVLGLMTEASAFGLTGGRGVLIFNQALERLTSGSKKTTAVLETLNVHLYNSKGQFLGLPNVIGQLHDKFGQLSDKQRNYVVQTLFGKGATGEFTEILRGGDKLLEKYTGSVNHAGDAHKAAAKNMGTMSGQLHVMWAAVQTVGGALGGKLIPMVKDLAGALSDSAKWLVKHKVALDLVAGTLAGVFGAAITTWGILKLAKFGESLKLAGGFIAGFAGSAKAAATRFMVAIGVMEAGEASLVTTTEGTAAAVDSALMTTGIGVFVVALGVAAVELAKHWKEAMKALEEAAQSTANYVVDRINEMIKAVNEFTNKISLGLIPAIHELGHASIEKGSEPGPVETETPGAFKVANKQQVSTAGGIMGFFEARGYSPQAAAGIVGNWMRESSLNPATSNKEGTGLASWTEGSGRKKKLEQYAHAHHLAALGPEAQLGFALKEMQERGLTPKGWHPKTPQEAAAFFNKVFEQSGDKPGSAGQRKREEWAAEALGRHPQSKRHVEELRAEQEREPEGGGSGNSALDKLIAEQEHGKPKKKKKKKEADFVDPFSHAHHLHRGREDMGIDFTMDVGSRIDAMGPGVVKHIQPWGGAAGSQPYMEYEITKGSHKGLREYIAEQITPLLKVGDHFKAGEAIARYAAHGTGLEAGIASGTPGLTLAASRGEFHDHAGNDPTAASKQFSKLLSAAGKPGSETAVANEASSLAEKAAKAIAKALVLAIEHAGQLRAQGIGNETTRFKDLTSLMEGKASREVELAKDSAAKTNNEMSAAAKAIEDASNVMKTQSEAAAQALMDASTELTDRSSGRVSEIKDAATVRVAELMERGKYGLDLQAQREEVALDRMKQQYDAQVNQARIALDQAKTLEDSLVAQKQISLNVTTQREDALSAAAQAEMDSLKLHVDQVLNGAQAKIGTTQLHADGRVGNDLMKQLVAVTKGSKQEQAELKAKTERDEKTGAGEVAFAEGSYVEVSAAANKALQVAEAHAQAVTAEASTAIATAQGAVSEAEAVAKRTITEAEAYLAKTTGEAAEKEAALEGRIEERRAEASTQYAGSGLVVNFTNIPSDDAQAIQSELGFLLRSQLPA